MRVRALLFSMLLCLPALAQEKKNRWTDAGNATPDMYYVINSVNMPRILALEAEVGFSKTRLGDGRYLQQHWAVALADFAGNNMQAEKVARRWLSDKGADSYACTLLASALYNQAVKARGGGYSDSVTDEGWATMASKLGEADKVLGTCSNRIKETLFWNVVRLRVTFTHNELRRLRQSHFEAAIARWPDADEIYEPALIQALPVWGGSVEEIEEIIQAATERTKSRLKTVLYARLYQNLLAQQSQLELGDTKADWSKMKQSMADFRLLKQPDLDGYLRYIIFACSKEDFVEVRKLLDSAQQRYTQPGADERASTRILGSLANYESEPCFVKARALPKPK